MLPPSLPAHKPQAMHKAHAYWGLGAWLLLVSAAAAAGGFASAQAADFYAELIRPSWAPPAWLFAPVWTALYLLMGLAAWRVWRLRGFVGAGTALGLFITQLLLNALWTWLFFKWRLGSVAFAEILLLWMVIAATIVMFSRVSKGAAVLMLPYLAWVSLAAALTFSTWQRNPGLLG